MTEYDGKHEAEVIHEVTVVEEAAAENEIVQKIPAISAAARTFLYIFLLVANVATIVVLGILVIIGAIGLIPATLIGGVVVSGLGLISQGLAVGYRPTRFDAPK